MKQVTKPLAALLACGALLAGGLAARPGPVVPTAHAQPAGSWTTLVDTGFDDNPVGSLPSPFRSALSLPGSWQPCASQSVVAVTGEASHSPGHSLKVAQDCGGGPVLTATGWTLPLPQYAPISRVYLELERRTDADGLKYLGIPESTSSFQGLLRWSGGLLTYENGTAGGSLLESFTPAAFDKVAMTWDFNNHTVALLVNDAYDDLYSFWGSPTQLTGFTQSETGFYDDDVKVLVEFAPSPTVVIDGCDTGVPDVDLGDGTTIFSLVMKCAVGAATHGEFESCVADLKNMLQKSQVITANQKGAIQSCAAQADIP